MSKNQVIAISLGSLLLVSGCAGPLRWGPFAPAPAREEPRQQAMPYFVEAKVFEAQQNHYAAIVALRSAADLDPTSPTIYERLAWNYNEIRDYRMAAVFARRALDLDPGRSELRYLLYRLLHLNDDRIGAAEQLEELIKVEPGHWRLYFQLAQIYLETGQPKRITAMLERALERPDTPVEVRVNIADVFARSGKKERAEDVYKGVLKSDPKIEDAWLGLATLQEARGDREGAKQYYRQAGRVLREAPLVYHGLARLIHLDRELAEVLAAEELDFLYRLGVAFSELGKDAQATAVFEHIVGLRPTTLEEWLELARYSIFLEDYDRADEILGQAAEAVPDSSALYLFWGMAMEQAGRREDAIAIYREGLLHCPDETDLYLSWGFALEQKKEWSQAIQVYRQGLKVEPPDPELYIRWGIVLSRQEKWQEAIVHYQQAMQADALSSTPFLHWGIALEKLERWEEAIEKLSRAVDLDPQDTQVLFYLGVCLEQASRHQDNPDYFDRAVEIFERVLEIDPDDAYALNYLGYMYADKGIYLEEAVELLLRAIALEPENSAFLDSLGWAFFRRGELERAEHYLDQALKILEGHEAEEKAVILDHAGDIAHALGKKNEARQHWQQALEFVPGNQVVRDKLNSPTIP